MNNDAVRQQSIVARIERLPLHSWHVKMRMIVGAATFFDGVDSVAIAYVLPAIIPIWRMTPGQIGLMISSGYIGQLLGSLFCGWVADRIGRVKTLTISLIIFSLTSLLAALCWNFHSLLTVRFVQGLGLGGLVPVAAVYFNEFVKAKGRGKFFLLYEMVFAIGLVFAGLTGWWLVPMIGWKSMFLIGALPGFLIPMFLRQLPESPRWLSTRGRFGEAEEILSKVEYIVSNNGKDKLPDVLVSDAKGQAAEKQGNWTELFKGIYLKRTLTVWVMWFATFFCNFGLMIWLPTIYTKVYHLPLKTGLLFGLMTSVVGVVGTASSAFLIDKVGRRSWFTGAFIGASIFLFALWMQGPGASAKTVFMLTSISYFFVGANSAAMYLYNPEIYPTRIRALGVSLGTVWYRVATSIAPVAMGFILANYTLHYAFAMYGAVALVGAIVTWLFAVETKDRILEELNP